MIVLVGGYVDGDNEVGNLKIYKNERKQNAKYGLNTDKKNSAG